MGLFSKKEVCCVCGQNDGKQKILDGYVCKVCLYKFDPFRKYKNKELENKTKEEVLEKFENIRLEDEKNKELLSKFNATNKVSNFIEFDDNNKLWLQPNKKRAPKVHEYNEIIEYEIIEDGKTITKSGLGRAVAGGILFGGVGAVVGGVTGKKNKAMINNISVKIVLNNTENSAIYIPLILAPTKSNSIIHNAAKQQAQQISSILARIIHENNSKRDTSSLSNADELIKLKQLLDNGVLNQEEFEIEKQKILNN